MPGNTDILGPLVPAFSKLPLWQGPKSYSASSGRDPASRLERAATNPRQSNQIEEQMSDNEEHVLVTDAAEREASGAHQYGRYLEEFTVGDENAQVLCGNIPTANATVYVIDTVLMP